MASPQQVALATVSSDTTTYTKLVLTPGHDGPSAETCIPSQACVVGGMLNGSSGTATIRFVLKGALSTEIRRHVTVTLTADSSIEDHPDGSTGGNYRATASPESVDLLGHGMLDPDSNQPLDWYVGVSAYTTVTAGRLDLFYTRAI